MSFYSPVNLSTESDGDLAITLGDANDKLKLCPSGGQVTVGMADVAPGATMGVCHPSIAQLQLYNSVGKTGELKIDSSGNWFDDNLGGTYRKFTFGSSVGFWFLSDQSSSGGYAGGRLFADLGTSGGLGIMADYASHTTGVKLQLLYHNQTQYYSALEVAHVASGFGTLSLMPAGGFVGIGNASPLNPLDIKSSSNNHLRLSCSAGSQYGTIYAQEGTGNLTYISAYGNGGKHTFSAQAGSSPVPVIFNLEPAASGERPNGALIRAGGNLLFDTTPGGTGAAVQFSYFNGTSYYSALEFASVASGYTNLKLVKGGGTVGIGCGSSDAAKKLEIVDTAAAQMRLTYTAVSVYTDFLVDSGGALNFSMSGSTRFTITSAGDIRLGSAALATNATTGFPQIPGCAGTPTGVPANITTGLVPLVVDTTNNKLYAYYGAAWHDLTGA